MYSASATFNNLIKQTERQFIYSGKIVTKGGTTYTYDGSKMRSGRIARSISGDSLEVGTVYSSEYDCELGLSISRYELYDGSIELSIELDGASDVIPMGKFTISEVTQTSDRLHIKSYDNMVKFDDVEFKPSDYTGTMTPFKWLTTMCTACGVTLGNTEAQIRALPNGKRKVGYADVAADTKTWRDVLGYLTAFLGGYAYIGRDGKLYVGSYGSISADTIPSSFRYTSNLSDYKTTYDGLYATYKEGGVQEYVSNTNTGGLILDLGANPFLQITDQTNRQAALQAIIDAWNGVYYVPFASDVPMIPTYDPGDVLTFTGNQAGAYDIGAITEITYNIGGKMNVTCSGDNPRLADAQDRFTKTIEGLTNDYGLVVGGKNFWKLHITNDTVLSVGSTETLVAEIEWDQKTFGQTIEMIAQIDAVLSATAVVKVRVVVDDDSDLESSAVTSKALIGERTFHCTNPQKVYGTGVHEAKVYLTVTDSPLLWSDLV